MQLVDGIEHHILQTLAQYMIGVAVIGCRHQQGQQNQEMKQAAVDQAGQTGPPYGSLRARSRAFRKGFRIYSMIVRLPVTTSVSATIPGVTGN